MSQEPQIIAPEDAHRMLNAAIAQKLGDDWAEHWDVVSGHDFMTRLTDGKQNIDFYVDLLGNVTIEEKGLDVAHNAGRMVAWLLLGTSLFLVFVIARIAGIL